ncbi:hypothetical protein DPEC_G00199710 [Dallia pectoralis]|uniref:Uncharacterized protein n=1 Tax=Dallia pectoralis TaxID=75939 RepID=A0ACC2G8H0_DALPE|nr:hypothetical protein DPEC_G00199710 [Dallia pectoralis]
MFSHLMSPIKMQKSVTNRVSQPREGHYLSSTAAVCLDIITRVSRSALVAEGRYVLTWTGCLVSYPRICLFQIRMASHEPETSSEGHGKSTSEVA